MKSTFISILIFFALIIGMFFSSSLQYNKVNGYIEKIENIYSLIEYESWHNISRELDDIIDNFDYESQYMSVISSNEYVDEIISELNDLRYYTSINNVEKSQFYINSIVNDLEHLQELQMVNIKNIF